MGWERKHDACEHTLPPCLTTRRSLNKQCELKEDEDPLGHGDDQDEGHLLDPRLRDRRKLEVIFRTREDCRNCGRSYIYRSTYQDAVDWEKCVDNAVIKAKQRKHDETMQHLYGHSSFEMYRARWKERIESVRWMCFRLPHYCCA